jgi:hypothetical protein
VARNDWVTFEEFSYDIMKGVHGDLSSATLKVGLINNDATVPSASTATPRWADFSGNEVSGTGYTAGGATLSGVTVAETGGVTTLDDTGNVTWSQNGAGPTDVYWAVLYNDTATNDEAIGFLDMGGPVSLVDGDITITWNASGILTLSVTA